MKKAVYFLIISLLVISISPFCIVSIAGSINSSGDSIDVFSTPGLYNISMKWAKEYNRQFPTGNIKIVDAADGEKVANMIKEGNIGFISGDYYACLKKGSLWNVVVGRDVIVPVVNANNPFIREINEQGISPEVLARFVGNGNFRNWSSLLKNVKNARANYYCIDDESAIKGLSAFLKIDKSEITVKKSEDALEVISEIQKDPYAIGFCKLINVIDFNTQRMVENIRLFPIDRNGNGVIDYNEKIYDNISEFTRGIWIGKYPKPLFSNIYSVASVHPEKAGELAFIKWVLSDGQAYLSGNGYSDLLVSERQSESDKLYRAKMETEATTSRSSFIRIFLFAIASIVLTSIIASSIAGKRKKTTVKSSGSSAQPIFDPESLLIPKGLYFDKTHTWAFLEENGNVKVGIDDFLQHITGKITRVKMKSPGKKVKKGDHFLSIAQNGKQLNLYAPVSGTIIEQNIELENNSLALNSSPYREGWIYRIEPSNWRNESQILFMADKQKEFIAKEFKRLKDFLMTSPGSQAGKLTPVMLQDGGEISDGVLSGLGPEIWEDFQANFIDPSRQVWFYELF